MEIWCEEALEGQILLCLCLPGKKAVLRFCDALFSGMQRLFTSLTWNLDTREVAVFFDQQLTCDAMGGQHWPGKQRSHGERGYIEFIQEYLGGNEHLLEALGPTFANRSGIQRNSPCPCGSGKK